MMMKLRLKQVLLLTGFAALLIRVIWGLTFLTSEIAAFNYLPGLDMATLLRFSEWTSTDHESAPMFVLHRLLLFACYLAAGKSHNVIVIWLVQSFFGIAGSIFMAWGIDLLSKNTRAALAGGLIYGIYGPFLLYESVALQESVLVHTLTIAFALLLYFRQSRNTGVGILCGIVLGLNSAGRPATVFLALAFALFPIWENRREKLSPVMFSILVSLLSVWGIAALFNGYFRESFSPFFNVMPHLAEVHAPQTAAAAAETVQTAKDTGVSLPEYFAVLAGAVKNVPMLFGMREIPENLDYDVIRKMLPILSFGPSLLMPFAVAGMIAAVLLKRKELQVLYVAVAFLVLPLASRMPIGRYRLMLVPFFIVFAVFLAVEIFKNHHRRLALIGIVTGVVGCNLLCASPLVRPNPAAHYTLALAAMKCRAMPEKHLQTAWEISNYSYKPSGLMLILHHMKKNEYGKAEKIILENRTDSPEFLYYLALVRTAQHRFAEAGAALGTIPEPQKLGNLYPKYLRLSEFLQKQR